MNKSNPENFIQILIERIRKHFADDGSGHGFDHIMRVYRLAVKIAEHEKCDTSTVAISALLHDVGDYKLCANSNDGVYKNIIPFLQDSNLPDKQIEYIADIIEKVSFKGNGVKDEVLTIEGQCVRDADRLDAMGCIGIARAFAYGALKGRPMYDKNEKPKKYNSFKDYKNNNSNTINHFYEKLFLLKDRMETNYGKILAKERHAILERFVSDFILEWEAEK